MNRDKASLDGDIESVVPPPYAEFDLASSRTTQAFHHVIGLHLDSCNDSIIH